MSEHITIVQGDITTAKVDAIVNAANPRMLGGGGVDGAIHRAAGPRLLEACRNIPAYNDIRCHVGAAQITPGFLLPATWVIHTIGPRYRQDPEPAKLLTSAYVSSLHLARKNRCQSIAFPAISCGVYGYPLEEAAHIALGVCNQEEWRDLSIFFFLFDPNAYEVWERLRP